MQLKTAAIGNKEALVLFESLGIDCFYEEKPEELKKLLHVMAHEKTYGIVFLAENLVKYVKDEIAEISKNPIPAIIIIPMQPKGKNIGLLKIQDIAARATGTKII